MANLLWHYVRDVLSEIGQLNEGEATGGSSATVVDSALGGSDDDWNGGTAIVLRDAGGAGAAPEGSFAAVTDYVASSGTITVADGDLAGTPASGDVYGVATSYFPLRQVIRAVNRALQRLGDVPQVDTTTLDTATSQTEYTAAVAWKRHPPFRIDVQGNTADSNDNRWHRIYDWEYIPATAGSTGLLVLPQLVISRDLRIWYEDAHAQVESYNANIYEGFAPELILWESVYNLLVWQNGRLSGSDSAIVDQLNNAEVKRQEARALHPIWKPAPHNRILILGTQTIPKFLINPT